MPYVILFSLPGVIASVVLFVLLYRTRKQDSLTRHRFLLPFIMVSAHTLLFSLGSSLVLLCKSVALADFLGFLCFILSLILLFTVMIYWGHFSKWKNFELRAATFVFTLYCTLVLIALLIAFSRIGC